jgi:hypothetical protein
MDRWLLGLVAGLLGGVGGALAVHLLVAPAPERGGAGPTVPAAREEPRAGGTAAPALEARPEDTLAARLERIEALLQGRQGRADAPTDPAALALVRKAVGEELEARLGALEGQGAAAKKPPEPAKKRATLEEAARELGLTSAEEADLRRIYAETQEKYLRILAGPDGDTGEVRRELDAAKNNPKVAAGLMAKYLPKALPKLGEIVQIGLEQNTAVEAAVGAEKAARLDERYDVVEANPFGGTLGFTASAGGPR